MSAASIDTTDTTTATTTEANRRHMQQIMAELDKGNGKPFVNAMADDFCWTIPGDTPWSRTYSGKEAVVSELLQPLYAQFATPYISTTRSIMADGDKVVVEFQGQVTTKAGKAYNNRYCYVFRMEGGQMKELMEYLDTALVIAALEAPPSTAALAA
ncbi:MAG: nuclear transport factor 2 family protein [Polaromonas sp.]|uniref:nuclear transport factor 2 family protein n=1 Tax=Polaromonas sp. TaxID=1869339 RepID=UPI0032671C15